MTTLFYKGIEFDDWAYDDEFGYWTNICRYHAEQYADIFGHIDDSDFGQTETCGVKGCYIDGRHSDGEATAYLDFGFSSHVVIKTLVQ